jgi:prephenate dehydrogenase
MGIQISIIGLDRVGQSLGMALKNSKNPVTRVGFDLDAGTIKSAEKNDAVEKTIPNLHSAVEKADIVLLNLTGGEVLEYAGEISTSLKDGATLINLAPTHAAMCEWGKKHLPASINLINATPVLAGGMLEGDDPSIDLFRGSVCVITSPSGTSASAIQLVVDLAGLLGASPLFSDPVEADGLLTLADLFPRIVSTMYLQAAVNQSGWMEAGKTAGPAFRNVSKPVGQFIAGKFGAREILLQKENVLRYLGYLQDEITDLHQSIQNDDEDAINQVLQHSIDEEKTWLTKRISGEWEKTTPEIHNAPASGLKKLLGIEIPAKKR